MSAGGFPVGYVHSKSIEALKRHSIDVGEPRSKSWDKFAGEKFDLIITVCDQAASESCAVFPGDAKKLHWSTIDPARAEGAEEEINKAFDDAFQMLKDQIEKELL